MNPSNTKFSSIIPKCLKAEDPEAEIFLRNHDLVEAFMSEIVHAEEVDLEEIDDILQDMIELIQNLIESLDASENRKEGLFWRSQIARLERDVQFHSETVMMFICYWIFHSTSDGVSIFIPISNVQHGKQNFIL